MLAPFVESIFFQGFRGIRERRVELGLECDSPTPHERWRQSGDDLWDCHFFWSKGQRGKNVVEGILQLANAVGLTKHLPADLRRTLQALFEYRNKMFHCGFEWIAEERRGFAKRIDEAGWSAGWFSWSTVNDEPWICYVTDTFVEHCLETIDLVLEGFGAFSRELAELAAAARRAQ